MNSSIGASPSVAQRHENQANGFLHRIRTSFSSNQRPNMNSPSFGSSAQFESGKSHNTNGFHSSEGHSNGLNTSFMNGSQRSMQGIGTDVRMRKRKSIFRRNGRTANVSAIDALPPQLKIPIEDDLIENIEDDHPMNGEEATNEKSTQIVPEEQKRYVISTAAPPKQRLEYHQKARLDVRRACNLLDQCAKEIKMRGLAMVGVFRPFRTSENAEEVERLIELYLLSTEPHLYQGIFALDINMQSSLLRDALGKPDPEAEFRKKLAYANIHDVVALFKWGLRRLTLRLSDLHATEQYSWYDTFALKEKEQKYPVRAFSQILLPLLSKDAARLLQIVLDLMSTIAAHHISNAMPAWRICRSLGYWLFGRVGIHHEPLNFKEAYAAWDKASKVTEHLFLVMIREQSAQFHLMPSRLTELVADYPYFAPGQTRPSLPRTFSSANKKALFVEVRTENVIMTPKQARRSPRDILNTSFKATNIDLAASEDVDDWVAIKAIATSAAKEPSSDDIDIDDSYEKTTSFAFAENGKKSDRAEETHLFKREDVRILEVTAEESEKRKNILEGKPNTDDTLNNSESFTSYNSVSSLFSRGTSSESMNTTPNDHGSVSRSSSYARPGGLSLAPLTESKDENLDWKAFTTSGFAPPADMQKDAFQLDKKFKPKSELEKVFEEQDRIEALATEKKDSVASRRRTNGKSLGGKRGEPKHILANVSSVEFDECFASVWQDQLLDDCPAARLPLLVCAQLNQRTSSSLLGNAATFSFDNKDHWLVINETIAPPKAPVPASPSSTLRSKRSSIWRPGSHKKAGSGEEGEESLDAHTLDTSLADDDDRQSLFSIRSGFSSHFKKPASGLRRMKSMLSTRKANGANGLNSRSEIWAHGVHSEGSGLTGTKESDIDAEVRELKAAVYADREKKRMREAQERREQEGETSVSIISSYDSTSRTPTPMKTLHSFGSVKRKPAPLDFSQPTDTEMANASPAIISVSSDGAGLLPPTPITRNSVQNPVDGSYNYSTQSSPTSKYLDAQD
ncbi:uncharacterized protein FA14DRAFT_161612 [Meira miltonrushii]|uniref:Rho-GAP domain-containing protein n=1 Tax=Meira miltonrushii TaxID=1280837 RepID=A0A316VCV7_9BASI|nr:uncharacterized protein FA14DRAFT_161612 [Meira miltonrushii]PWN34063.1 hypothetical protein FA14DRAFT_161612 [Meira miltonrushii]